MKLSFGRRGIAVVGGLVGGTRDRFGRGRRTAQNPTYNLKGLEGSITADGSSTVGPYTQRPRSSSAAPAPRR